VNRSAVNLELLAAIAAPPRVDAQFLRWLMRETKEGTTTPTWPRNCSKPMPT